MRRDEFRIASPSEGLLVAAGADRNESRRREVVDDFASTVPKLVP